MVCDTVRMIINKVNVRDFIDDSEEKIALGLDLKEAYRTILYFFKTLMNLPLSKGSVSNFNEDFRRRLEEIGFFDWAKKQLLSSLLLHADESGINIGGKGYWLHTLSNGLVTLYGADQKRGKDAMGRKEEL